MNSHQFFANKECEYYPCHKMPEGVDCNCLFCYCPLYLRDSCPGNPSYVLGRDGSRIKDCSQCTYPHHPSHYELIMQELTSSVQMVTVSCEQLYEESFASVAASSGIGNLDEDSSVIHKETMQRVYEKLFQKERITVALKAFDKSCVKDGQFMFPGKKIPCQVLEQLEPANVRNGYLYTCHAPEGKASKEDEKPGLLEQYYVEAWQIAFLDGVRAYLRGYLTRRESVNSPVFVTDSFGPGYYGIPVEDTKSFMNLMGEQAAGVRILENGNLTPLKSLVGAYLVLEEEVAWQSKDCVHCLGNTDGCQFCQSKK